MPRSARVAPGGLVYHVLNRAVAGLPLFEEDADYEAFEQIMAEALQRHPIRLLAYQIMPDHWHMVIWPREDGELTAFLRWLTHTHAMRWHAHRHTSGSGPVYQGRFKSFPVQADGNFYTVVRYVEQNARRAKLVRSAKEWRWSSLRRRVRGSDDMRAMLSDWPIRHPADWLAQVKQPLTEAELQAIRRAVQKGSPYGSPVWQARTVRRLGLESTLRPRGRPRKHGS